MFQILAGISPSLFTKSDILLPLSEAQCHICAVVSDSTRLFEAAALWDPDIILLDLQLPGLEDRTLLFHLRKQNPRAEWIILSENRSFEEAHAALQCGSYEFLLKPLQIPTLQQHIHRLITKLLSKPEPDSLLSEKQFIGKLFIEYAKKVPPEKQMNESTANDLYQTHFVPEAYRIVTICIESADNIPEGNEQQVTEACAETLLQYLGKECQELLPNLSYLRINALLNYNLSADQRIREALTACQIDISSWLPEGMLCTFCCSGIHSRINEIREMLNEAVNTLWSRFYYGKDTVLYPETQSPCPPRLQSIYETTEHRLKSACSVLDLEAFQQALTSFFSHPDHIIGRHETRELLRRVEYYMLDVNRNLISSFTDINQAGLDIVLSLRTANTLNDYKNQYATQLISLFRQILSHHGQQSQPIRQAQRYIHEHYASSVKLSAVAEYVGLTPVYLSTRFKEELGIGFSDYLNRVRIDISKKLLLETDEKVLTIALMVGYSNPRYYSRVFRELEGIRPTDYRISKQRNQR